MSDTPISDSTPHNVAELGMLCRRLERELHTANEMLRKLNIHALNLTDRIRRLEEAGDLMVQHFYTDEPRSEMWEKAKEAKL
jgi:DNA-binding HxlR family transcriptional regulator